MRECTYCSRCYEDSFKCCPHDGQALVDTLPGACLLDSKYQLEICLGRGGMGAVYRANHIHLRRAFAIKTILPEFAFRDPKAADRFLQEARTAAAIQHPNIVTITDFGTTNFGLFYYVMECIEGTTLRDELQKNGAMSPERVYRIFKQVLAGVAAAHRLHMVHRDLKPSNIMLTKLSSTNIDDFKLIIPLHDEPEEKERSEVNELAKVVDFGLAKFIDDSNVRRVESSDETLVGSPIYMSPEQCEGNNIDERSDIYSLGVILYHMLTGEVPFKGDSLSTLLAGHLLKEPPSLRSIRPDIPEKLERVVLKALAKKPLQRQQSVAELAEEFEAAMAVYFAPEFKTVTLSVQTIPPACEIYIDDVYRGRTNVEGRLVVKGLPAGSHSARIILTGYLEFTKTFTAPIGEYSLQAQLQRKEDLALAANLTRRTADTFPTPERRASGSFERTLSNDRETPTGDLNYRVLPPAKFSIVDLLLACGAVIFIILAHISAPIIDPFSVQFSKASGLPIESLVAILSLLSIIGFTSSIIMADQSPAYRNSTLLSNLFNVSSTVLLITIILPLVLAFPLMFVNLFEPPPKFWFVARLLVLFCCFALQHRVRIRRRVPFLP
ncbi:MAG: serine/threonine-protein kinase [Acidobacteriota bacterium]